MRVSRSHKNESGFTVLELVALLLLLGVLTALFLSTYASVQRNQRNQERQRDVQDVYQQLEAYYVTNGKYPTLVEMNTKSWVTTDMKTLNIESLRDPSSKSYQLSTLPTKDRYAYQVSSATGTGCNDTTTPCAHYTLTATLENSAEKTYVKSSLN